MDLADFDAEGPVVDVYLVESEGRMSYTKTKSSNLRMGKKKRLPQDEYSGFFSNWSAKERNHMMEFVRGKVKEEQFFSKQELKKPLKKKI